MQVSWKSITYTSAHMSRQSSCNIFFLSGLLLITAVQTGLWEMNKEAPETHLDNV